MWGVLASQWEEGFEHLKEFKEQHGHCRVSQKYNSSDGYRLGAWVNRQRSQIDNMPSHQKAKLDILGFVWDPFTLQWEEGFVHLQAFAKENGHCKITAAYKTVDGYELGGGSGSRQAIKTQWTLIVGGV